MDTLQKKALINNLGDLQLIPKDQNQKPKLLAQALRDDAYYQKPLDYLREKNSSNYLPYLPLTPDNYDDPRLAEIDDLDQTIVHFDGTVTLPKKIADDTELRHAFEKVFQTKLHQGKNIVKFQRKAHFTDTIGVYIDERMLDLVIDDFDSVCKYNLIKQKVSFDIKGYAQYEHAYLKIKTLKPFVFHSKGHFYSMQNWHDRDDYIIIGLNDSGTPIKTDSILHHFKLKTKEINADILGISKEQFEILHKGTFLWDDNDHQIELTEGQEDNARLAMIHKIITKIENDEYDCGETEVINNHHVPALFVVLKEICKHVENQRFLANMIFDQIHVNQKSYSYNITPCLFNFNHRHSDDKKFDSYYQILKTPELDFRIGFWD